ncbi:hypothetical protein [Salinicola corii]|uniref:hypothetical protein n=1 Tax=Salinicola corii TaxID=2606937 RepID=UPI001659E6ED|nr:hypothetical protein [Salinicola corii]
MSYRRLTPEEIEDLRAECSGSMKPDTSVGGILPTLSEVSYGKKTTTILQP